MKIKEWPREERPRERLIKSGSEALSDAQLLAILLRTGSEKEDVLQLATHLLKKFFPLPQLLHASIAELCTVKGIGPAKAVQIKAAIELGRRSLLAPSIEGEAISKSGDVFQFYAPLLATARKESFKIILLNQKNKIMRDVTISEGSLTSTVVHPREAFQPAIRDSAASVIFLHNHPSGDPSPSDEDKRMTIRLIEAGELLGIPVLDHVIMGDKCYFSFADAGYTKNGGRKANMSVADQKEVIYGKEF